MTMILFLFIFAFSLMFVGIYMFVMFSDIDRFRFYLGWFVFVLGGMLLSAINTWGIELSEMIK